MVWRTSHEEFEFNCTVPTVKHAGGSVMIWDCFRQRGVDKLYVLDGIMDKFYYRDILKKNLLPSIEQFWLEQQCIFMHANDPKHTSKVNQRLVEVKKD